MSRAPNRRFRPAPATELALWGTRYVFREHPSAPGLVFAQEGGRGIVYQVEHASDGELHGFKVFASVYRVQRLADSQLALNGLAARKGLRAAHRRVLLPQDAAAIQAPDLSFAVLMPWIRGRTWYDSLQTAESKRQRLHTPHVAMKFALDFLDVMSGLEQAQIAHTDISPGNVTLDSDTLKVELLDLEDMYFPDATEPSKDEKTCGTPGYQHHKRRHTWRPEGDRYATAILTSELLLLSDDELARRTTTSGFYGDDCTTPEGRAGFELAMPRLSAQCPAFAELFERAWSADSLAECPRIAELRAALLKDSGERGEIPVPPPLPPPVAGQVRKPLPTGPEPWGWWQKDAKGGWTPPARPAARPSAAPAHVLPPPGVEKGGSRGWLVVLLMILAAIFISFMLMMVAS